MALFKSKSLIGLDITASEIRLVMLKRNNSKIKIEKFAIIDLPEGVIQHGEIKQPNEIITRLNQSVIQLRIKNFQTAIALPDHYLISKRLRLASHLTEEACEVEIIEHLNQYVSHGEDELYFDFILSTKKQESDYQEVSLYAAKKSQMDAYLNVVNQSGLVVKLVEVDAHARDRVIAWSLRHADLMPAVIKSAANLAVCVGLALRGLTT